MTYSEQKAYYDGKRTALSDIGKLLDKRISDLMADVQVNHLPRIKEGLERKYADENQMQVAYDHMLRARVFRDFMDEVCKIYYAVPKAEGEEIANPIANPKSN